MGTLRKNAATGQPPPRRLTAAFLVIWPFSQQKDEESII